MISLGPFILIAGISIVILLCWAWLPFAIIAKLCGLGAHRKKDAGLLPVRAAAGEVRYRAEGFVPPPQALQSDPHAFDPEVRHHNYLKVDPRRAEQNFQNRGARDAYEAAFGLGSQEERRPPNALPSDQHPPPGGNARYALLFNSWIALSGFYIQSSGDFITDYKVEAMVCGATGNFTYVPLVDPQDGDYVWSDTLFIEVTAAKGNSSTAIINEIWPVFPGDDIFDPENTSPCPAASRRR
ncbi:hypothetical protein INS49_014966 [Diaporthe citri]|uniref:uncharacterized protein n=1 Tax=Diaporthe citri TaxID=83186 RepID=UPI001C80D6DA|nr:uncharacterized protein INS49_014966 [Diaporthe citri]KAG6357089.1 hypothetical protein INS49_014966 [Diaporthe citri]